MKTCFKCGTEQPLSEFYANPTMADGHLNHCKKCCAVYERERGQRPERKSAQLRYAHNYKSKWPEKRRANIAVSNAVRDGRLEKRPCEVCGNPKVNAHHDDYSKPLDVRWLCEPHHFEAHGRTAIHI